MKKFLMVVLIMFFVLVACSNDDEEVETEETEPISVQVETVDRGDLVEELEFIARLSPNQVTPVIAPGVGELDEIQVNEGDEVEEGDILFSFISIENGMTIDVEASQDGIISNVEIEAGDMVSNEAPALLIVDMADFSLTLTLTEQNRHLFEQDASYTILHLEEEQEAIVSKRAVLPNDSGMYEITFEVDNEKKWPAGAIAIVRVDDQLAEDVLLIPSTALNEDRAGYYVYRIQNDQAERVTIEPITIQTLQTAIEGDLEPGDRLITRGQFRLDDGDEVVIDEGDTES